MVKDPSARVVAVPRGIFQLEGGLSVRINVITVPAICVKPYPDTETVAPGDAFVGDTSIVAAPFAFTLYATRLKTARATLKGPEGYLSPLQPKP